VKRIIRTKWVLNVEKQPEQDALVATAHTILIAPVPSRTVNKGLFGESLLAYLVIGKYGPKMHRTKTTFMVGSNLIGRSDHLPLHRQIKIFQRTGIYLAASTVSDNIAAVAQILLPLYNSLKREVLANRYLQADESPIRVQDHEKPGACHLGYFWAYHAPVSKLVLFEYQKGRGREGPAALLKDFEGILQTDGYVTYSSLFEKSEKVTLAGCMAHVRRYFDEAVPNDAARAKHAISEIAKLYAIEQQIRSTPEMEERDMCLKRIREASPILEELHRWLQAESCKVTPNSPIGKAITYALKLWDRLTLYLFHGQLQINNNLIENLIRPIALGRKNGPKMRFYLRSTFLLAPMLLPSMRL
jgi:transposase